MIIIIECVFIVLNFMCMVLMYKTGSYKAAMFNAFAAGVSVYSLLSEI